MSLFLQKAILRGVLFREQEHPVRQLKPTFISSRPETNRTSKEAIRLYRGAGYAEVKAFNAEPYAHYWFEKRLERASAVSKKELTRLVIQTEIKM